LYIARIKEENGKNYQQGGVVFWTASCIFSIFFFTYKLFYKHFLKSVINELKSAKKVVFISKNVWGHNSTFCKL
jgi:hypothetical protein